MTSHSKIFLITVIFAVSCSPVFAQGYRIGVYLPDLPGKEIILSHRMGLKFFTDDTVKLQGDSRAVFSGDTLLPQGMYQIVFPDKKYIEFFLGPVQFFDLQTRIDFPNDSLKFTGSSENSLFISWQNAYGKIRTRITQLQERLKQSGIPPESMQAINNELKTLQNAANLTWDRAIRDLDGTLAGSFLSGLRPVKIPDSLLAMRGQDAQYKQYRYLKDHFFSSIDFSDSRLIRTPIIETKLDQYFNQLVAPFPDSIIVAATSIIDRCRAKPAMFQFVVQYLLNLYSDPKIMGTDAVYVWLAENFYLNGLATWIDPANLQGIGVRVAELKPLLLGAMAPALSGLITPDGKPVSLESIKDRFLILFLWEPGCSHCKEVTPKLYKEYPDLKALGAEVLAVNTRTEKDLWMNFITENKLNWLNVYSPTLYRENTERYQAWSTPRIFILDEKRRIIAKDLVYDQVKPFLQQAIANQGKK